MKSPSFEVAQKVGTIVLGQIVVDEVCNKYRENLEEKATKTRKAILELNDPLLTPHEKLVVEFKSGLTVEVEA